MINVMPIIDPLEVGTLIVFFYNKSQITIINSLSTNASFVKIPVQNLGWVPCFSALSPLKHPLSQQA